MQLINVKCIILVDLIISRNISIPLNQDWCVFSSSGFQLGWNISIGWCFVCYMGKGSCNSWKDLKCLAAGEVWSSFKTSCCQSVPSAVLLWGSCSQQSSGWMSRTQNVPVCGLWDHLTSRGGVLWIFPYGSGEQAWARHLPLLPLFFIPTADKFYKAVHSLLLFQSPCSLWISGISVLALLQLHQQPSDSILEIPKHTVILFSPSTF